MIHLLRHSQKVHREENGAVHFWRIKENLQNPIPQSIHWSMSPRPHQKISLKHEWKRELGLDHAQRAKVGQQFKNVQSNQPTLNPFRERLRRSNVARGVIGVRDERKTSRSQEIERGDPLRENPFMRRV